MGVSKQTKFFWARVKSGSFKRMFDNINQEHANGGVNRVFIFFDMCYCILHYGIGYLEYRVYNFSVVRDKKIRETYMNGDQNIALTAMLDDPACCQEFENKLGFMKKFVAYTGRQYIDLSQGTPESLAQFCANKPIVFAKHPESFGGLAVERIETSTINDYPALYQRLTKEGKILVETGLIQHPQMARLAASSINTLRIVTVLTADGPQIIYTVVRASDGIKTVDNGTSGGMYTVLSADGIMHYPMFCDANSTYYDVHPVTKTVFNGFEVPYYQQAIQLCKKATMEVTRLRYVGWDVAITPDGPVLIEGNILPGYEMVQNSRMMEGHSGILPVFEKALGFSIPRHYDGPFIPVSKE